MTSILAGLALGVSAALWFYTLREVRRMATKQEVKDKIAQLRADASAEHTQVAEAFAELNTKLDELTAAVQAESSDFDELVADVEAARDDVVSVFTPEPPA